LHAIAKDYGDTDGDDDEKAPDDNRPYLLELPGGANTSFLGTQWTITRPDSRKQSKPRLL
jgi:hypothetical protein